MGMIAPLCRRLQWPSAKSDHFKRALALTVTGNCFERQNVSITPCVYGLVASSNVVVKLQPAEPGQALLCNVNRGVCSARARVYRHDHPGNNECDAVAATAFADSTRVRFKRQRTGRYGDELLQPEV